MNKALEFRSRDTRFAVRIPGPQVKSLLKFAREAGRRETGGILVGYYSTKLDCAHVTEVSAPPSDSKAGGWSFERGVRGLAKQLSTLWNASTRTYYLGEWHFHPYASPEASGDDRRQMRAISVNDDYRCPEPLLLILGGDPNSAWDARAYVFPVTQAGPSELRRVDNGPLSPSSCY